LNNAINEKINVLMILSMTCLLSTDIERIFSTTWCNSETLFRKQLENEKMAKLVFI